MEYKFNWITEASLSFLNEKSGYLLEGETPHDRFTTIGKILEEELGINGYADTFLGFLDRKFYALSTPFISNVGRANALPFSCSNQHVGDSLGEIGFAKAESAMLTKMGMGCSGYMDLRGKGSGITDSITPSPGSLYFAGGFQDIIKEVNQGVRRGYMALYWDIDHDDILDVLDIQRDGNPLTDINYGVCIGDDFMERAKNGDIKAQEVLMKVHESRFMTGMPYIFFKDTVNKVSPDVYKDNNFEVRSSNLCVAPETLILTDKGHVNIKKNVNKEVDVWNGSEYSTVTIKKTSNRSKLVTVNLSDGSSLTCTLEHKWYLNNPTKRFDKLNGIKVSTKDLRVGDKLIKWNSDIIHSDSDPDFKYAYTHGFFCGDGTYDKRKKGKKAKVYLYGDKKSLKPFIENDPYRYISETPDRITIPLKDDVDAKFTVPLNYSLKSRLEWLEGYLDADGTIASSQGFKTLQATSINRDFLMNVKLLLQTMGVQSKVVLCKPAGTSLLPKNDGSGESKLYKTKALYRLLITSNGLFQLCEMGFSPNRLDTNDIMKPQRDARQYVKVLSVVDNDRYDETYCFTEPIRGMGVFNGILTGQCTEILEVSDDKYSFVCDIAAMNAEMMDEPDFPEAIQTLTYALDALHSIFQRKLEAWRDSDKKEDQLKFLFMEKVYAASKDFRDIGVGCTGYATLLQSKMIPFESLAAKMINAKLFKTIRDNTLIASKELALLYGEPEMLKGYGRRNCLMNAVAPNTSSAFILGQISQGIEPLFSNYYVKDVAKSKHLVKNKVLEKLLEDKGFNTTDVWKSIAKNDGSVSHLECLTEEEKNVFKTFQEISPMEIIVQAAQRQQFIDQSQSVNLMINHEVGLREVNMLLFKAWELGIKTLYYQHGTNAAQQLRKSILECESCAG